MDTGQISSYDEDLSLRTGGADRLRIRQTDGFVGIGTVSPTARLEVNGDVITGADGGNLYVGSPGDRIRIDADGTLGYLNYLGGTQAIAFDETQVWIHGNDAYIGADGRMGLGTTAPAEKLDVEGRIRASDGIVLPDGTVLDSSDDMGKWESTGQNVSYNNGNMGIGTLTPQSLLTINGTLTAREVVGTMDGWADYVFAEDYDLMLLTDLHKYVAQNGHLPGIPSEETVVSEGVSLGEMQGRLLAKVEELTLHLIQMNDEFIDVRRQLSDSSRSNTTPSHSEE